MTEPVATAPVRAVRRRRTRLFVLLGILLLLVFYTGMDLWAGRKLDATLARLEPRYGGLRGPAVPSLPAAENRARLIRAAAALTIPPPGDIQSSVMMFGGTDHVTPVPPELRAYVDTNRRAIQLATEFPTRARSSWDVDYSSGGDGIPFLDMRALGRVLYISAVLDLEAHRSEDAIKTAVIGLELSESLSHEPQLIAQLVRVSLADWPLQLTQRVLQDAEPSKSALLSLADALARNRAPDPAKTGLEGEMAHISSTLSRMEAGRTLEQTPWVGLLGRLGRPFVRFVHVRYLEQMDRLVTVQAGPRPRPASPILPLHSPWSPVGWFLGNFTLGLERTMETSDDSMSEFGAAEIAVALRRYKLDHGSYPDALTALVPAYLDQLPINPFTGKPPSYEARGAGFTLHSPRGDTYARKKLPLPDWQISK